MPNQNPHDSETLRIALRLLRFSDGTELPINDGDVVVLVGPNNVGKSRALQDVLPPIKGQPHEDGLVIRSVEFDRVGSLDCLVSFLQEIGGLGTSNLAEAKANWLSGTGLRALSPLFVSHLTAGARLDTSKPIATINFSEQRLSHPLHRLFMNPDIEVRFSSYFKQAFKEDLILNRLGSHLTLHCGTRADIPDIRDIRDIRQHLTALARLPPLHEQGDGMRSFVGVLLHTLDYGRSLLLLDEPEAFLHPPQARLLGRLFIKELSMQQTMLVATHSGDFLRGLLDTASERVRIVRLQRDGPVNHVTQLDNEDVRNVWMDPLLRYSNVLDGVFHQTVVLCEGDSDCRFYAAVNESLPEGERLEDAMFIHCGGKQRMPMVIDAMRALGVPIRVIADFDVLNDSQVLGKLIASLGGEWSDVGADWTVVNNTVCSRRQELPTDAVRQQINQILSTVSEANLPEATADEIRDVLKRASPWSFLKNSGKSFISSGDPTVACERMLEQLRSRYFFVVEGGTLERFVKSVGGHGPKWANEVLQLELSDKAFDEARAFVRTIARSC